jgi:hypothetical protein
MPSQSVCTMTLKVLRDTIASRDDLPQEKRTELCSAITRLGKIAVVTLSDSLHPMCRFQQVAHATEEAGIGRIRPTLERNATVRILLAGLRTALNGCSGVEARRSVAFWSP